MSETIMVSVVMTAYNHGKYIREALDGVAKQKVNFPYEIVVHDDASTDDTQDVIRGYLKEHPDLPITPILQEENQHSKKVRFKQTFIYPHLHGKYIITCECDDFWIDENKLQRQVDFLESHPEYVGVGHNCVLIDENGERYQSFPYQCYGPFRAHRFTLKELAFGYFPGQTATLLFRREKYFQSINSHSQEYYGVRTTGDKKRNLELLLLGDIYYFEEAMSAYRIVLRSGSSWSARNYQKNRLYSSYLESMDCREYARKVFNRHFPNEYSSFHTVLRAAIERMKKPTQENKKVLSDIIREDGSVPKFLILFLVRAVRAFPQFLAYKLIYKKRYMIREN